MADVPDLLWTGPSTNAPLIVLAHGAGTAMDTPFMNAIADGLAASNIGVARFEFRYMSDKRKTGKQKPPDRLAVLTETWMSVVSHFESNQLFIGGKSMGGRIASLIADEANVAGLICLGYPFHPPGKPDKLRTDHLETLNTPALIIQGSRDAFGNETEVSTYSLSPSIRLEWLPDGDHSFKPRKSSSHTESENIAQAIELMIDFVQNR